MEYHSVRILEVSKLISLPARVFLGGVRGGVRRGLNSAETGALLSWWKWVGGANATRADHLWSDHSSVKMPDGFSHMLGLTVTTAPPDIYTLAGIITIPSTVPASYAA